MSIFSQDIIPPEDYNKTANMDPGSAARARDHEAPRSPATPASSIDVHWDGSPAMTRSSNTPVSAPVTTPSTEPTNEKPARIQFPSPLRLDTHIKGNEHNSYRTPPTLTRHHPGAYELEVTTPSTIIANGGYTPYRPGRTSQHFSEESSDLRKSQAGGTPSWPTAHTRNFRDLGITPATAIHYSEASDTTKKGHGINEKDDSDPFLGTEKPMEGFLSGYSVASRALMIDLPSPSLSRLRSSQLGDKAGPLTVHDAHKDVLSLLDKLKAADSARTRDKVNAALTKCQEDLRARSKDKTVGTAEANILDREAAKIGRMHYEAARQALSNVGSPSDGEYEALQGSLRLALARLVTAAHAMLNSDAQTKRQAASASKETTRDSAAGRVGSGSRVTALDNENRVLKAQVDRFQSETSDLQKKLEVLDREVKAYRREVAYGCWEKDGAVDSKRGG
jgi:hypothetical protein